MNIQADSHRKDGVLTPMNGIEKIIGRITADTQTEIDQMLREAQLEAETISAGYVAQAQLEEAELLERGQRAATERGERLASVAHIEGKKHMLSAKQDMLDKAFRLAQDKLTQLPEQDYISLLAALAASASLSGAESLIFTQQDQKKVGEKVVTSANARLKKAGKPAALTLSEETQEMGGGLLIRDGRTEVNCAFNMLLRLSRIEIAGEVAAVLFQ